MERFQLLAQVKHSITDVVTLTVEAESEKEAFRKAEEALSVFPRPSNVEGIPYCYIEHRKFDDTKVVEIENMEKDDGGK